MIDASHVREHMEVKGADGGHVGTVDRVEGSRIKLTRSDPASGGQHHYIDLGMVDFDRRRCGSPQQEGERGPAFLELTLAKISGRRRQSPLPPGFPRSAAP